MYAIIEAGGKQFKVSEGDTITADISASEQGTAVTIEKVLAIVDGAKSVWGTPYIKGAAVKAEVLGTGKGKKVLVYRKRPRRVYEKLTGHRQPFVTLKINKVSSGG